MKTYTQEIYELSCPYDNQYQGKASRYLFVCSAGLLRSPTAASVADSLGYNSRSCGSHSHALIPISVNLIHWAHKIFFMEENNFLETLQTFEGHGNEEVTMMLRDKSVVWEIEDYYDRNAPTLRNKVCELLK
jgi:predicted protein tyrosine phosphatase